MSGEWVIHLTQPLWWEKGRSCCAGKKGKLGQREENATILDLSGEEGRIEERKGAGGQEERGVTTPVA